MTRIRYARAARGFGFVCLSGCLLAAGCTRAKVPSLVTLVRGVPTAAQHEVLAREYRDRAREARSLAALHIAMAAAYGDTTSGTPAASAMVDHCRELVRLYEAAARQYEALAENHSALAEGARERPGREFPDDRDY